LAGSMRLSLTKAAPRGGVECSEAANAGFPGLRPW
jgi:hypothetical protein